MPEPAPSPVQHSTRIAWLVAGWFCFGVGLLGFALPGLPTTGPMLLALACFSKGSKRLHSWLLNHKTFGPSLRQWEEERTIPFKAKITALVMMCCSLGIILTLAPLPPWGRTATAFLIVIGMGVVICVPHQRG